jgi:hypothetical protein
MHDEYSCTGTKFSTLYTYSADREHRGTVPLGEKNDSGLWNSLLSMNIQLLILLLSFMKQQCSSV